MFVPYKLARLGKVICLGAIMALSVSLVNPARAEPAQKIILAFGDSLTAGYGIPLEKSFPAQLEEKLTAEGHNVKVINAGVSGDTTSGGLTRLAWTLEQHRPDFVILELGANDMLRGIDPDVTKNNLQKMLDILKEKKLPVLLAGMKASPNLGLLFSGRYEKIYKSLAKEYDSVYYPFFLEGAAMETGMVLEDGLHPNAEGIKIITDRIYPSVEELLEKE